MCLLRFLCGGVRTDQVSHLISWNVKWHARQKVTQQDHKLADLIHLLCIVTLDTLCLNFPSSHPTSFIVRQQCVSQLDKLNEGLPPAGQSPSGVLARNTQQILVHTLLRSLGEVTKVCQCQKMFRSPGEIQETFRNGTLDLAKVQFPNF